MLNYVRNKKCRSDQKETGYKVTGIYKYVMGVGW